MNSSNDNIDELASALPTGYEEAAKEKGAFTRARGVKNPHDLMGIILLYLVRGTSVVNTCIAAKAQNLGNLSAVAFVRHLGKCVGWFSWILENMKTGEIFNYQKPQGYENYQIQLVDASTLVQKGAAAKRFKLHFALNPFAMQSVQYKLTDEKTGESMQNFKVTPQDLFIGDRAYGTIKSMEHVLNSGGNFIFRLKSKAFKIYNDEKQEINVFEKISKATQTEPVEVDCHFKNHKKELQQIKICAVKKSPEAIEKTQKKIIRRESKNQIEISDEAKVMNEYIVVVTSLCMPISKILDMYRIRWQVELYFKRLKSIMDMGDIPCKNENNIMAWLLGKLIVALLVEVKLSQADFSPSGL